MANFIPNPLAYASVGPVELTVGRTSAHEAAPGGDEHLDVGVRVERCHDAGRMFAATVTAHGGNLWRLPVTP